MLDERKIKVLYAIINSYINSAEPIGSRTISKEYDLGVSSATIRNEMSDLEDLGYLSKPHSSAGRVPSDKAYRMYVDELLEQNKGTKDTRMNDDLIKNLIKESNRIDQLIQKAAKILSVMTNYTSIVASPKLKNTKIDKIQLVAIDNVGVLIVIVCDNSVVKNTLYKSEKPVSNDELLLISNYLTESLKGLSITEISDKLEEDIFKDLYEYKDTINDLIPTINEALEELISIDIYSDGITNILNFPEYNNIDKAKEFISFVEDKDLILEILLSNNDKSGLDIIIGQENIIAPIKDISMITASYSISGKTIGKLGLVGPTRMDYPNLIRTVYLFSQNISEVLDSWIENN